ncbi:hypothetical protein OIU78_000965 [Salix suchowensis]|nr:hypothetical protein OIU78_000965 [Salix suchowensis]
MPLLGQLLSLMRVFLLFIETKLAILALHACSIFGKDKRFQEKRRVKARVEFLLERKSPGGLLVRKEETEEKKWAAIASYLPQRTDNDIKNYWNTHLKKKLKKLQAGQEGQSRDGLSVTGSQQICRGQWERRLQTDIHMARQALCEALSPEKPDSLFTELKPSGGL